MRVVNIIEIVDNNTISIESFGVFEEQLSDDVVQPAEKLFKDKARENGAKENELDECLDDGYYQNGNYSVNIVWSEI